MEDRKRRTKEFLLNFHKSHFFVMNAESDELHGVHIPYDYDPLKKMHFCQSSVKNMIGTLFHNTPRESRCSDHRPVCEIFAVEFDAKNLNKGRFRKGILAQLQDFPIDTQPSTESNYDSCKIQLISPKEEEDDDEVS
ncbi:hypothetical protein YC2023_017428 [Brassica napus]